MSRFLGIDCGSVSVKAIVIDEEGAVLHETAYLRHHGALAEPLRALLEEAADAAGPADAVAFTGIHGERLAAELGAPFEVETVAQVAGTLHVLPGARTIISIGGQSAALFQVEHHDGGWQLESFSMNGPCASGTGSFIDQQAERLAASLPGASYEPGGGGGPVPLEEFIGLGLASASPAPVACRCTVFTKSDMIHLQNKGEPLANIIAGLHAGNAANFLSTIVGTRTLREPMALVGGVAANPLQLAAFRRYYPELVVPPHHASLAALGAALLARERAERVPPDADRVEAALRARRGDEEEPAPRLALRESVFDPDNSLPQLPPAGAPVAAWLGIDIGSTTTKYALVGEDGRILHKAYVQTNGKPIEVARALLGAAEEATGGRIRLSAVATTGSGRQVVGDFLGADLVIDEITAHARGAAAVDPEVDTIFEIGGQDAKYISLVRGRPLDFDMNKVCAAGTGSFLHELASKLRIGIVGEFQERAFAAERPVALAERCTVFMESDIQSHLQKGAAREDLVAGLSYAVVRNYLNRVVGKRPVGRRVMFLGGPSLNRAIVAAFEGVLGRGVLVPRHREVMGAYGAALAVREAAARGEAAVGARRLGELAGRAAEFTERVCTADRDCHNQCKLKVYDFGGRRSVWGGECGRYEAATRRGAPGTDYFRVRAERLRDALGGRATVAGHGALPGGGAPTIGVPVALHGHDWGLFWVATLSGLGWRVVTSPPTDGEISRAGVEAVTAETCYPVKVFHGHVRALAGKVDRLFLPNVVDMPTPSAPETGFFCPYVQGSQWMARAALGLPAEAIVAPTLRLREGPERLAERFARLLPPGSRLGRRRVAAVVAGAWEERLAFRRALVATGEGALRATAPGEAVWVVSGRPYNLYDERLNLRLGRHLASLGIAALPMDFLDLDAEELDDFPGMYWGLGSRVLRAARRVARTPGLFGVHLTNFGCGPDSFLEHFIRHVMDGKPALTLELDEHSAVAGTLTRVEAFRNVVHNVMARERAAEAPSTPAARAGTRAAPQRCPAQACLAAEGVRS